jgi:hypothetical protein
MKKRGSCLIFLFFIISAFFLSAQTHVSVPVDDPIYYVLDIAQLRGLCDPLPAVKPYSRNVVISTINDILASEASAELKPAERKILEDAKAHFEIAGAGLDWERGAYHFDVVNKKGENWFSGDLGFELETVGSAGYYIEDKDVSSGTNTWVGLFTAGDVGKNFSFGFNIRGGFVRAPRAEQEGLYHTYYDGFVHTSGANYNDREIITYTQPASFFPYTFKKEWDGFVFGTGGLSATGMEEWPEGGGIGSTIKSELGGALFGETLSWRFGRLRREWAGMDNGSSLVFNSYAQPFMALEVAFRPVYWFGFSALTGVLEHYNGYEYSAWSSQNAFSIEQIEFNIKNYFHFDVGSTVVWPKRFELGYIFPINNNFMYQNNIGDFDNMGLFFDLKGRYPGVAELWLSGFVDEIEISSMGRLLELDRHMFAYQGGIKTVIPWLPFASLKFSYTKIEPYTYTHNRTFAPWYGSDDPDKALDTSYTNNGVGLGYYLPPNSDELLVRLEMMPALNAALHFQYQMIRRGADHGSHQVDGSSYRSELDPDGRSSNPVLQKFFLHDGAYQWMHILKAGTSYKFAQLPVSIFGEAGLVLSYYTDVDQSSGTTEYLEKSSPYSRVDTPEYPKATGFIFTLGVKIFP